MIFNVLFFVALINAFVEGTLNTTYPQVFAEWAAVNFTWDVTHKYADYVNDGKYIVNNCLIAGVNVDYNGDIYLTVPRWRPGVPATLNKLNVATNSLTPYPSWEMQEEGVDGDLQNCQSMTIDSSRNMWIIEVGRRNFYDLDKSIVVNGAAGLWIADMDTGAIKSKYYFPDDVVSYDNSFLNDIALDEARGIAYFSDAWGDGAIIVYDSNTQTSYRYSGSSTQNEASYRMVINGNHYGNKIFVTPIDGIALTSDCEALFYSAVQGTTLYRLPTAVLRDRTASSEDIDRAVEVIGNKEPSDGIKYLNGTLYWGALPSSTYYRVKIDATSLPNIDTSVANDPAQYGEGELYTPEPASADLMQWVDTWAVDLQQYQKVSNGEGSYYRMFFTSNKLDLYSLSKMDFSGASGANMHLLYVDVTFNE